MIEKFKTLFFVKSSLFSLYLALTIPIPFISIDELKIFSIFTFFLGIYLIISITNDYTRKIDVFAFNGLSPATYHHKPKMGAAMLPPPRGVSFRRPPQVCQRRAELISNWLCPITAGPSRHSFEQFVRAIRSEVFFPLSFPFPRSLGTTANPTPKSGKVWFFRIFGRFFRLPNRA